MPLIVVEGIDGAGKTVFLNRLINYLCHKQPGISVHYFHFPDYDSPIGKLIKDYLNKRVEIEPTALMLLYLADMKNKEKLISSKADSSLVFLDRYLFSTIAYQGCQLGDIAKVKRLVELLNLPRPELVIFLDYDPAKAVKRTEKDRFADASFLTEVRKNYLQLAKENFYAKKWLVLDAEKVDEALIENLATQLLDLIARLPEH